MLLPKFNWNSKGSARSVRYVDSNALNCRNKGIDDKRDRTNDNLPVEYEGDIFALCWEATNN